MRGPLTAILWARSIKDAATKSYSPSGSRSVVCPGPCSVGRRTKAVLQPALLCGLEVAVVGGDHADLFGPEAEGVDRRVVDPRIGLVGAGELGAEDHVPGEPRVLGEVDRLRDVAVRARADDVGLLEEREALDGVRPRVEPVPRLDQRLPEAVGDEALESLRTMSSPIRCSTSRFDPRSARRCGRSPVCGWYCARQSSANVSGSPNRSADLSDRWRASPRRCRTRRRSGTHLSSRILTRHGGRAARAPRRAEPRAEGAAVDRRRLLVAARRAGDRTAADRRRPTARPACAASSGTSATRPRTCPRRRRWPPPGTSRGSSASAACWPSSAAARASTCCSRRP